MLNIEVGIKTSTRGAFAKCKRNKFLSPITLCTVCEMKVQTIINYSNGTVYEGEVEKSNDKTELINGKMTFPNGHVYEGEWNKNNQMHRGTLVLNNGVVCVGKWRNNKFVRGKVIEVNGVVHEGKFNGVDDYLGHGKITYANGEVYEGGEFRDGEFIGKVKFFHANGDVYEGANDGAGVVKWVDGRGYDVVNGMYVARNYKQYMKMCESGGMSANECNDALNPITMEKIVDHEHKKLRSPVIFHEMREGNKRRLVHPMDLESYTSLIRTNPENPVCPMCRMRIEASEEDMEGLKELLMEEEYKLRVRSMRSAARSMKSSMRALKQGGGGGTRKRKKKRGMR
jgi:hypothetical protein